MLVRNAPDWGQSPKPSVLRTPKGDPRGRRSIESASRSAANPLSGGDGWSALVSDRPEATLLACAKDYNAARADSLNPGPPVRRKYRPGGSAPIRITVLWRVVGGGVVAGGMRDYGELDGVVALGGPGLVIDRRAEHHGAVGVERVDPVDAPEIDGGAVSAGRRNRTFRGRR
jgi:hypothetical protein